MPWVGLQYVIVVFPDHAHLLFALFAHVTKDARFLWDKHNTTTSFSVCCYLDFTQYDQQEMPQSRLIDQHMAPRESGYITQTVKNTHIKSK